MAIHILPSDVASQIAAGEVVERPASVVKELLENALDAHASQISIKIESAGRLLIEVADNGDGIPANELALAVERHATSKLQSAADLFHITTLGFRGEALASIGSVARLTISSRPATANIGARLRVEGGQAGVVEVIGTAAGTLIRVENLFYNVPARLKFLKHDTTERRQIDGLVTRYALAYPHVRFQLLQESRPALQTSGNGDQREILSALYGPDIARQMLEVAFDDGDMRVFGFISPTSITRTNRREMTFFVNGRPVQDAALISAMLKGYHTLLMVGRYPMAVLFLEIPAEAVDVNVHPTKAEVRFRDSDRIFSGVQRAVRRALLAHTPVPGLEQSLHWGLPPHRKSDPAWSNDTGPSTSTGQPFIDISRWPATGTVQTPMDGANKGDAEQAFGTPKEGAQGRLSAGYVPILRLVGQIASTYLVAEGPDGLYLIDQHAAHERVLFERFISQRAKPSVSQALLQPTTVELPAASARLLDEKLPLLERLGFAIEPFGPNTYLVRAIPAVLAGSEPSILLRALVEDFEEDETPLKSELEARLIARICKRAAIKAGRILTTEEQHALLSDLEACQSPRTCPHGRPTMIHLSVDLLERQFGRRGAR